MDTLYTFWDDITHYKTENVYFFGLMNSATIVNPRKLEHGFRRIGAGIPYTLP